MSKYTTGEIASLCGVSVRTVQYYDTRSILVPGELSEGGRRLYSDEDLAKMRIICFLREIGFSIDNIGTLFSDGNSESVILMLIEQQEELLSRELEEQRSRLDKLYTMKRGLRKFEQFSVESIGDIARIMENRKKRKRLLLRMVAVGIVMDIIEVGTIVYGAATGNWIPLIIGLPVVIGLGVFISVYYYRRMAFICPSCHEQFKARARSVFWAAHTPSTRRLRCPKCGKKSFCVETYAK